MKDTAIIYAWMENEQYHEKEISRQDFLAMFDGLAKGFGQVGDNEISRKLIEIIPEVEKLCINKDINVTQDIPYIECFIDGNVQLIKILRRNDIVWRILHKYCIE